MNGLELALSQALDRRDAAARVVAQARQGWGAARAQLEQLETYASECTDRWATKQAGCMPEIMRHHYQFMARLTHAIVLQTGIVGEALAGVEREAGALREAESKLESLRQLNATRLRGERQLQDRREQKQSDESASLQYRRLAESRMGGGVQ
jgi:flagellar FliJ protein